MKAVTGMKKIEALIAKSDIQAVEERLEALGIDSVSITPVIDHRKGNILHYRGGAYRADLYKFKLECLVTDQLVPSAIETIAKTDGDLARRNCTTLNWVFRSNESCGRKTESEEQQI
jgi:nitrogen regulatory protein PII